MIYADTLTWTRGKHSFKFGGEIQRTKSYQEINGSVSFATANIVSPYVTGGAPANSPNTGLYNFVNWSLPGMTGMGIWRRRCDFQFVYL